MEGVISILDRFLAPFIDRTKRIEKDMKTLRKASKDINDRIDKLENVVKQAQMNGEDKWFLCTQRKDTQDERTS